jgi:putative N6-adenine-specific DNA methylase
VAESFPQETLFITTTPGLERVLLAEARGLGDARAVMGGVRLVGPAGVHRRANLELRCASRVWLEVARLKIGDASALRETRRAFKRWGPLQLKFEPGLVLVNVDSSGELLYRRGYRQEVSRAPLRETLAAGLLQLAGHQPGEPLWDPLCGSGTLVIEAALTSRGIAAGLHRTFAFERFPSHDSIAYRAEKEALAASVLPSPPAPLWASDLNAGSLGTARRNAARAGVQRDLKLFRHDATQPLPALPEGALVISNLPYGKRAGGGSDLRALYRAVVKASRQSGAARAGFLAADPKATEWLGLEESETYPIENGGLKCLFVVGKL